MNRCINCERLEKRVSELETENANLKEMVNKLLERIAKYKRNSSNSSKAPSSDIIHPERASNPRSPRKQGAQVGHKGNNRLPLPAEMIDEVKECHLTYCPYCKKELLERTDIEPIVQQTAEIPEKLIKVTEYRRYGAYCQNCKKTVYAPLPEGVPEGQLCGPRLQSLFGYLKGRLYGSYTLLKEFAQDVLSLDISRGGICNIISRVNEALKVPYEEVKEAIRDEKVVNVDETGWRDKGSRYWVWIFSTALISLFTITKTRSSEVLKKVLGEVFGGVIVSDFYSAYVKYANALQQFCLAHLIRSIKFLTTLPNKIDKVYGNKLLKEFKHLFFFWHRKGKMPKERYRTIMERIKQRIRGINRNKTGLSKSSLAIAKRLDKHWNSIFRFLFADGIPPTNNAAEQPLRIPVIGRKIILGSCSEMGKRWNERIWTVIGTCRKQKRSPWKFLYSAIIAYYFNRPYPSLLPNSA